MIAGARHRLATLLAFGVGLAGRGFLARASIVIGVLTVLGMWLVASAISGRSAKPPLHDIPIVASSALAWGGGFMLAFGAAVHALRRDAEDGIRGMLDLRSIDLRGYLVARVGGIAVLVAAVVAGGTFAVGIVAALLGLSSGSFGASLQATFASVLYGIAFAVVIAPTALAALGARTRVGGYLFLLGVVVVPELFVDLLDSSLPAPLADVLSIPSALGALRGSLVPGGLDAGRLVRALVALVVFAAVTTAIVKRDAGIVRREVRA